MRILRFDISNFKGIRNTTIELGAGSPGRVITLIGLNESGKTTILEAISNFVSLDSDTQTLVETVYSKIDAKTLIPKDKRGRFSDKIRIKSIVEIDESDIAAVSSELSTRHNAILTPGSMKSPIVVEKSFIYKDSSLTNQMKYWTFDYEYTKRNGYIKYSNEPSSAPTWQKVAKILTERLPSVVYFPTFLFDMPNRIYISELPDDTIKNSYYRKVLSDALKSVDPAYSLSTHVLDRINSVIKNNGLTALGDSQQIEDVDAVVRDLSNEISRVIIGAWKDILDKDVVNLRIELKWGVDQSIDNAVYLEPYIVERQQYKYLLKERSLGFRWFFSFLLFTQFRQKASENGTIFLFDEPASHLHSAAQTELLNSFQKIMGPKDYIIYSTHSHHMINPLWLEKAYIVNNNAVDLESDVAPYQQNPNDIRAVRYKKFVSDNPTRLSYFQPALDALKVRISPLEISGPAIILEGKFDYYPFVYLQNRLELKEPLQCFAAQGAGEFGILISLFRGWGLPFTILLDDDDQGRIELDRYRQDYLLTEKEGNTLSAFSNSLKGKSFEAIFRDDTHSQIANAGLSKGKKVKEEAAHLFQHLLATQDMSIDLPETIAAFAKMHKKIRDLMGL